MRSGNPLFSRIPSKHDLFLAYLVCLFPIQAWSWFVFLYKLPSYLLSLTSIQTISIFAYLQVFALLEAGFLWGLIVVPVIVLTGKGSKEHFIPRILALTMMLAIWAVGVHLQTLAVATEAAAVEDAWIGIWTLICLGVLIMLMLLAQHRPRIATILRDIVDRLTLLSGLYLAIDILAVIVLAVRALVTWIIGAGGGAPG